MGKRTPNKFFRFFINYALFALLLVCIHITMSNSLRISNRVKSIYEGNLYSTNKNSRLQITQETTSSDDNAGSIFDDQNIEYENQTLNTTPSSSTSPRSVLEENEENPNKDLDERFTHMMSIENTEPEANATVTETPSDAGTSNSTDAIEEVETQIKYVVVENPNNYKIETFNTDVVDIIYPSENEDMILYGSELILAMFGIILAIKFFLSVIKEFSYFQLSQFKMNAAYALLRDLTIYIFVLSILIGMVYLNYFDFIHTNLLSLLYGFYIFILIWV